MPDTLYHLTFLAANSIVDVKCGINGNSTIQSFPEYIVRLAKQVVTVSIRTVELVRELSEAVTAEDWLGEPVATTTEIHQAE